MAMTGKQQRNGVPGPDATGGVSQPGPDATADIRAAKAAAEARQRIRKSASHLRVPADTGVAAWDASVGRP